MVFRSWVGVPHLSRPRARPFRKNVSRRTSSCWAGYGSELIDAAGGAGDNDVTTSDRESPGLQLLPLRAAFAPTGASRFGVTSSGWRRPQGRRQLRFSPSPDRPRHARRPQHSAPCRGFSLGFETSHFSSIPPSSLCRSRPRAPPRGPVRPYSGPIFPSPPFSLTSLLPRE